MKRASLAMAAALIAALPAAAQQVQGGAASPSRGETVPLQLKAEQVAAMQQKLNERGFFAGRVDGLWGPDTAAAVRSFQQNNSLPPTGQLDPATLQALGIVDAAALPAAGSPAAAPSTAMPPATATTAAPAPSSPSNAAAGSPTRGAPLGTGTTGSDLAAGADPAAPAASVPDGTPGNPPGTAVGRATDRTLGTNTTGANPGGDTGTTGTGTGSTGTVPGAGIVNRNTGTDAASGDTNQAVATTNANAPQPAKGANSFTDDQARRRFEGQGYANVADLKKDDDGVWRGSATKDGAKVGVWLDYKGNIGQN